MDFGKYGIRSIAITDYWRLVTEEDKSWQPRLIEPKQEPMCGPEEATLENLQEVVSRWEETAGNIESGRDDDPDEYLLDLSFREELHGILNGFASQKLAVPDMLKARIEAADKHFVELTFEIDDHAWGSTSIYDKTIFWYYYRWPIK